MSDLSGFGVSELSAGLGRGDFSSLELTEHFLRRIGRLDPALNAFITVDARGAREAARRADALRKEGRAGPLAGVPIAHKDLFSTRGIKTTCASRMLADYVPEYDAAVVERLAGAGAVTLGKTNMDEFAMGSSNETSAFGEVKNPWDTAAVPGGSSGGSAAAVAAGLCAGATGTDTGGSIRQPAALCGVTGFKPTYGNVSRWGMIAFASSLDQAGTLTKTAEDAALLMDAMGGHDPRDSTSAPRATRDYWRASESAGPLTVGLVGEWFAGGGANAEAAREAATVLEGLGHRLVEVSLPRSRLGIPAYYVIASAECSSNLARYDGVRYGHRCDRPKDLADMISRTRGEGFGAEVKRRVLIGGYVLSIGYYDAYYLQACRLRRLISEDFSGAFGRADVLLGPTTLGTAFGFGEKKKDPVTMYREDTLTVPASLAGLPALSLPCGFARGKPLGVQLVGRHFEDAGVLALGRAFQARTDWHKKRPSVEGAGR